MFTRCYILLFFWITPLMAQNAMERAEMAMGDGLPEIAVQHLETFLSEKHSEADLQSAGLLYAEALIKSGQPRKAIMVLEKSGVLKASPAAEARRQFLLGEGYSAEGNREAALQHYRAVPENSEWNPQAVWGAVLALRELGKTEEAMTLLKKGKGTRAGLLRAELELDAGNSKAAAALLRENISETVQDQKIASYLQARLALISGKLEEAETMFGAILKDRMHTSLPVYVGSAIGQAHAQVQLGKQENAAQGIENIIALLQNSPMLARLFRELDAVYRQQQDPSDTDLQTWANDKEKNLRQQWATFYLANFPSHQKSDKNIETLLETLITSATNQDVMTTSVLKLAQVRLENGDIRTLLTMLPLEEKLYTNAARARFNFILGEAYYRNNDFQKSAVYFENAARLDNQLKEEAEFNKTLIYLAQGSPEKFEKAYRQFSLDFPNSVRRQELILEEGLLLAKQFDASAVQVLERFTKDFPDNPRVADAQIASAELSFLKGDIAKARILLDEADQASPTPESRARSAYLHIILEEAEHTADTADLINRLRAWLEEYQIFPLRESVQMKLGELYYQSEDYLNAQVQFQSVASETEDVSLGEKALFLAAESAIRSRATNSENTGLDLFEEVYRRNGSMKLRARIEQARLKARRGSEKEALVLYDSVLNDKPSLDERLEAMIGKGETLLTLGDSDPQMYAEAVALFGQAAKVQGISDYWKNQALWKEGQTFEKMEKNEEALAAYYGALEGERQGPPEYFWFYKCGFNAARLLEAQEKWASAVALYRKLMTIPGPRSEEAKQRKERLELQHFMWAE